MGQVRDLLLEHPELVDEVASDDGTPLDDPEKYFDWTAGVVAAEWTAWTTAFLVRSEEEREAFISLISSMARCYPQIETEIEIKPRCHHSETGQDNGVDPEAN